MYQMTREIFHGYPNSFQDGNIRRQYFFEITFSKQAMINELVFRQEIFFRVSFVKCVAFIVSKLQIIPVLKKVHSYLAEF